MSEAAASSLDPKLTPRLVPRELTGPQNADPAVWGVWGEFAGHPMLVTNGTFGVATFRMAVGGDPPPYTFPGGLELSPATSPTSPTSATSATSARDDAPATTTTTWGAFGQLGPLRAVVAGGSTSEPDGPRPELWLWTSESESFVALGSPGLELQTWGVWGRIDERLVVATGGDGHRVHLWEP
jgi:hypothetical protein